MIVIMTNPEEFEMSKLTEEAYSMKFKNEKSELTMSFRDFDHLKEFASQIDDFIKEQENVTK